MTNLYNAINSSCSTGSWFLEAFSLNHLNGIPVAPFGTTTFTYNFGTCNYIGNQVGLTGGNNIIVNTLPQGYYKFKYFVTDPCCNPASVDLYIKSKNMVPIFLNSGNLVQSTKKVFSTYGDSGQFDTGNSGPYQSFYDTGLMVLNGSTVNLSYKWYMQNASFSGGSWQNTSYQYLTTTTSSFMTNLLFGGQTPNNTFQSGDVIVGISTSNPRGWSYSSATGVTLVASNATNSANLTTAFRLNCPSQIQSFCSVNYNQGFINLLMNPYPNATFNDTVGTGLSKNDV